MCAALTSAEDGHLAGQLGLLRISCAQSVPDPNTGSSRKSQRKLLETITMYEKVQRFTSAATAKLNADEESPCRR